MKPWCPRCRRNVDCLFNTVDQKVCHDCFKPSDYLHILEEAKRRTKEDLARVRKFTGRTVW